MLVHKRGDDHHATKITQVDVEDMLRQVIDGVAVSVIAASFGVTRQRVYQILRKAYQ